MSLYGLRKYTQEGTQESRSLFTEPSELAQSSGLIEWGKWLDFSLGRILVIGIVHNYTVLQNDRRY